MEEGSVPCDSSSLVAELEFGIETDSSGELEFGIETDSSGDKSDSSTWLDGTERGSGETLVVGVGK